MQLREQARNLVGNKCSQQWIITYMKKGQFWVVYLPERFHFSGAAKLNNRFNSEVFNFTLIFLSVSNAALLLIGLIDVSFFCASAWVANDLTFIHDIPFLKGPVSAEVRNQIAFLPEYNLTRQWHDWLWKGTLNKIFVCLLDIFASNRIWSNRCNIFKQFNFFDKNENKTFDLYNLSNPRQIDVDVKLINVKYSSFFEGLAGDYLAHQKQQKVTSRRRVFKRKRELTNAMYLSL